MQALSDNPDAVIPLQEDSPEDLEGALEELNLNMEDDESTPVVHSPETDETAPVVPADSPNFTNARVWAVFDYKHTVIIYREEMQWWSAS